MQTDSAVPLPTWTPDRVNLALRLYLLEGMTASEVAAELGGGLSRGAVVSKVRRLGFLKREAPRPRTDRPSPDRPAPTSGGQRRPPSWPPIPLQPLREVGPTGEPMTLAELHDGACRWPIDDPGPERMHLALFCAGPALTGPYCAAHRAIAFATSSRR